MVYFLVRNEKNVLMLYSLFLLFNTNFCWMDGSGSKNFFLSRARQKEEREQNLRSMRNTNVWIDDKKLEEIFNPYGKIISAGVMHCDHDGVSKRLGLVRFSGPEQANNALEALNGIRLLFCPYGAICFDIALLISAMVSCRGYRHSRSIFA